MNILDKITAHKRVEINRQKAEISIDQLKNLPFFSRQTISLKQSLLKNTGIIAEFKRQSPSKGMIHADISPEEVVYDYELAGAAGISILTDKDFFGGGPEDILKVRDRVKIPILRKDFMIDEYQFYRAKAIGADVVLLIAACLSSMQVQEFTALAHELNLEVLLEIHTEEELKKYNSGVDFVGINNRNLKDFKVNLQHSVNLKDILPKGVLSVAESGIGSVADFKFLREKGFNGFLMGEYFMKQKDPGAALKAFIKALN